MLTSTNCPACGEPSSWSRRLFLTGSWTRWSCARCQSRLLFDMSRRAFVYAAGLLLFGATAVVLAIVPGPWSSVGVTTGLIAVSALVAVAGILFEKVVLDD